ncbi:DUF6484 domain-containing protein [Pseudorhodoferax sp. LjRoot39]|uniref:DUF6484 domain-containing protein n=1 Tax=Pseudorhodoferax sp. LjRoot39 TaxID=3342328 RepID=UPI003ECE02A8
MDRLQDPSVRLAAEELVDDLGWSTRHATAHPAPAIGRLQGFDQLDQPMLVGLSACPGQVVAARSIVPLRRAMVGREVLVLFAEGNLQSPVVVGVVEARALREAKTAPESGVTMVADGERHLIEAEREIVLRCGDASITLTRAGKVIIQGNYILSRSRGYNKIKGAAIDIN